MNPIKTIIADDDVGMRAVLRKIVERAEGFALVAEAENGDQLLKLHREHQPELVIMDVEMPELTGIECARIIQDHNPKTVLIFATGHDKYMGEAFEVYAFDFLLKPFKLERAQKTLSLVKDKLRAPIVTAPPLPAVRSEGSHSRLMIKSKDGIQFIDTDQLLLIQREERQTVLYAQNDQRFITGETLLQIEARLPKDSFFRCHKSYIVNIAHIESITPYGRWTYVVQLRGTKHDALITTERFEILQNMFA